MKFTIGDYIIDPQFGIGRILGESDSEDWFNYEVDFDIRTKSIGVSKSNPENTVIKKATKKLITEHLKYRNYELGNERYLTEDEMASLKVGDLILRNRKGFARILSFGKNDKGLDIMNLKYLESGHRNTFNRYDSNGAIVRYSFKHDLTNEFWEQIDDDLRSNFTKEELEPIEEEFGIKIPDFYKNFLIQYPDELLYYNRKRLSRKEKFFELEVLKDLNSIRQNYLYFEAFEQEEFWPIGSDGIGNYYAVKQNGEDEKIYLIDHEVEREKSITLFAKNLTEFINKLLMREMEDSYRMINK